MVMGGLTLQCRTCFHRFIFFLQATKQALTCITFERLLSFLHVTRASYRFSPVEICLGSICTALSSGPSVEIYRAKGVTVALKDPIYLLVQQRHHHRAVFQPRNHFRWIKTSLCHLMMIWLIQLEVRSTMFKWLGECKPENKLALPSRLPLGKKSDNLRPFRATNVRVHPSSLPPRLSQQPK